MIKAIQAISNTFSTVITGTANAITPLINSLEHVSKSVELHAKEIYLDTEFDTQKSAHTREQLMSEYKAELKALSKK